MLLPKLQKQKELRHCIGLVKFFSKIDFNLGISSDYASGWRYVFIQYSLRKNERHTSWYSWDQIYPSGICNIRFDLKFYT